MFGGVTGLVGVSSSVVTSANVTNGFRIHCFSYRYLSRNHKIWLPMAPPVTLSHASAKPARQMKSLCFLKENRD